MKLKVSLLSQRDSRWSSTLLGYNTDSQYSIGMYGCLITCLAMYTGSTPDKVNQLLKDSGGFTAGSGNFIWSKCTALGLNQTYSSPRYDGPVTPQGIQKIKDLLDAGLPCLCEIDFNPATEGEEMHYVLLSGYDDDSIFACDPWTGQYINLDVYGGPKRAIIQFRAYDKVLPKDAENDLQSQLDQCRQDRDRNWNYFTSLCDILGVGANIDLAQAEARKLVEVNDHYEEKDKALSEATQKVNDLETKLKTLQAAHDDLVASHGKDQKTIQDQGDQIKSLQESIQELKQAVSQPLLTGWQMIVKGIGKLIVGR